MKPIASIPETDVLFDGRPLAAPLRSALVELFVRQRLSAPTQAELSFRLPIQTPTLSLKVATGSRHEVRIDHVELFAGQVTAVEYEYESSGGTLVRVRGYDKLHQLRKRQSVRAHVDRKLEDLAKELASTVGLGFSSATDGATWARLVQFHQSDFELLAQAAEFCGQYFVVSDDTLHLMSLRGTGESCSLTRGVNLFEATVELNAEFSCDSVTATGWDAARVVLHQGTADRARVGRNVGVGAPATSVGGSGRRQVSGRSFDDENQAKHLAQGELDRRVAGEVTLRGVADGNPRLRPGTTVALGGVEPDQEGDYVLSSVTHSIDVRKGFVSEFSSAPPIPRCPGNQGAVVTWGIVADVDDPSRLGRIRATLPAYDGIETGWMGVVVPGGGKGKGAVMMPDRGDNVLVVFTDRDPAQGFVLGGLFGCERPPDRDGINGGSARRYSLITPGGQMVRLDDGGESVRIENGGGDYLELSPQGTRLHSAADLTIDAPGRTIFIRGGAIRFEEA